MEAARRQGPFYLEAHEEIRYAEERPGMDVMCLWCLPTGMLEGSSRLG